MKTIDYQVEDGVAILTIDVKERTMNVLTPDLIKDLRSALDEVKGDDAVKGAVITSAKDSFVAGADLMQMVKAYDDGRSAADKYADSRSFQSLLRDIETSGKPFAAAINGTAANG
ncbi:MAG: enoyl-CoA hydratase/isomerase family protein, partial [Pseudomonadota bacterium]